MRLFFLCVCSLLLGTVYAYVSPNVYRRVLRREGVPERMIPHRELEQLARRIDRAQGDIDVQLAEAEFLLAVRKSYRWTFPKIDQKLAMVNRIFRWGVTFQRTGFRQAAIRYDGDFSKIHKVVESSVLREAAYYLTRPQLRELERRISELDRREHNNIMLAYELTRKERMP
ncbi:putative bacteriochlorophyll 4-vinyl reductase [Oesophagostomum dentatum]|uniref:Putative bacteriochlorophyll 4-vinyl reductase n=1 Tax=Oesophagostomum dentatum TaxID=61180 RepID=A0A0B1RZU3_OESDE|nr:putative bacteriochlorophyll 4-vinyl reductase [Oesophagostomum dentatum]